MSQNRGFALLGGLLMLKLYPAAHAWLMHALLSSGDGTKSSLSWCMFMRQVGPVQRLPEYLHVRLRLHHADMPRVCYLADHLLTVS